MSTTSNPSFVFFFLYALWEHWCGHRNCLKAIRRPNSWASHQYHNSRNPEPLCVNIPKLQAHELTGTLTQQSRLIGSSLFSGWRTWTEKKSAWSDPSWPGQSWYEIPTSWWLLSANQCLPVSDRRNRGWGHDHGAWESGCAPGTNLHLRWTVLLGLRKVSATQALWAWIYDLGAWFLLVVQSEISFNSFNHSLCECKGWHLDLQRVTWELPAGSFGTFYDKAQNTLPKYPTSSGAQENQNGDNQPTEEPWWKPLGHILL